MSEAGAFTLEAVVAVAIAATIIVGVQSVEANAARRLARMRANWSEILAARNLVACLPRLDDRPQHQQMSVLDSDACKPASAQVTNYKSDGRLIVRTLLVDGQPMTHLSLRMAP